MNSRRQRWLACSSSSSSKYYPACTERYPPAGGGGPQRKSVHIPRRKPIYFLHDTPYAAACDAMNSLPLRYPREIQHRSLANYGNVTRRIGLFPTHCRASQEIPEPGICTALQFFSSLLFMSFGCGPCLRSSTYACIHHSSISMPALNP